MILEVCILISATTVCEVYTETKGIHMKATSLIHGKTVAIASAVAVSAALAIGMVGCASNTSTTGTSSSASNAASSQTPTSPSDVNPAHVKITEEEALKAALSYADLKQSQIKLEKNELDTDGTATVYEIEFLGPDNMKYDVEVDASNGTIFSFESELSD